MNLIDVLTEEGFNSIPANYDTSNSTNVYERVAAESNPDYAPMLASINKHMDNDLNRKRTLFGILNSIKQRRDAITDATIKYNREVDLERIKSLLDMREKLLELKTKKRLGLGNSLTYDQKVDIENLKFKNKKDYVDYVTQQLRKRLEDKNDANMEMDDYETENKKGLKTYNINEDLRKQERVQKDKVDFQNIKHEDSMEQIEQKHKNNVEFQGIKQEDLLDALDIKHNNGLETLLYKSYFDSLRNQEKYEQNKKLIQQREESAIKRDDNSFKNKESLEDKRHKNKTEYETQTYTNRKTLSDDRIKAQRDAKQIDKEIQEGKNTTNLEIEKSRKENKEVDERIQDKKLEAAKLDASTGTNKGYNPPTDLITGPKPGNKKPEEDNSDDNNSNEGGLWDKTKKLLNLSRMYSPKYGFNRKITNEDDFLYELGITDEIDFA